MQYIKIFLIKKAENMGLRGIVINWLRSYLDNRKQYVEFRNNKSSLRDVVCGVLRDQFSDL